MNKLATLTGYLTREHTRNLNHRCRFATTIDLSQEARDSNEKSIPSDIMKISENAKHQQSARMDYVDFVDKSLAKMKDLGIQKDINGYKELLKVFPPGRYHPKSRLDMGMFNAPQQLCGIRIINQMEMNGVKPDKEIEILVERAFSRFSTVWQRICRENYWTMKGRNVDRYPLPEKLPKQTHELAKLALERMAHGQKTSLFVANTSSIENFVDKTWVVYAQSVVQQETLESLDEKSILHVEECGITYVREQYLNYFALKIYDDENYIKTIHKKEPTFNYNRLKYRFHGKPLKEKLREFEDFYHIDNYRLLALGVTGTSSNDSLSSWIKIMQRRNPKLAKLTVVFHTQAPTPEISLTVDASSSGGNRKSSTNNHNEDTPNQKKETTNSQSTSNK